MYSFVLSSLLKKAKLNNLHVCIKLPCLTTSLTDFEERLWTPIEKLAKDTRSVTARLARFRCLLNQRGVAAAPLAGYGRSAPSEPGSCLRQ
jgi:hypothetical protein